MLDEQAAVAFDPVADAEGPIVQAAHEDRIAGVCGSLDSRDKRSAPENELS